VCEATLKSKKPLTRESDQIDMQERNLILGQHININFYFIFFFCIIILLILVETEDAITVRVTEREIESKFSTVDLHDNRSSYLS